MKRLISLCLSSVLLSGAALAVVPGQEGGQIIGQGQTTQTTQTTQTPEMNRPTNETANVEGQTAQQGAPDEVASQQVSAEERSLVLTVHAANLGEIKASLIAFTRPVSQEVRDFAWKIINDHLQNDHMLQELSRTNGLDLVSDESIQILAPMLSEQREMVMMLEDTAVADFEKAYIDLMRRNHDDLVLKLDSAAAKFTDSRFGDYIRSTSESVKLHIADLQRLVEEQEAAASDVTEPAGDVQKPAKGEKIDIEVGEEIGDEGTIVDEGAADEGKIVDETAGDEVSAD